MISDYEYLEDECEGRCSCPPLCRVCRAGEALDEANEIIRKAVEELKES